MKIALIKPEIETRDIEKALEGLFELSVLNRNDVEKEERLDHDLFIVFLMRYEDIEACLKEIRDKAGEDKPFLIIISGKPELRLDRKPLFDDFVFEESTAFEIATRTKVLLSRFYGTVDSGAFISGDLAFDFLKYEVRLKGEKLELTFKEYELLKHFATNPGRVFTRDELLKTVWDYWYFGGSRTVDVHIRRLRSKMDAPGREYIKTMRGVGYYFDVE